MKFFIQTPWFTIGTNQDRLDLEAALQLAFGVTEQGAFELAEKMSAEQIAKLTALVKNKTAFIEEAKNIRDEIISKANTAFIKSTTPAKEAIDTANDGLEALMRTQKQVKRGLSRRAGK